VSFLDSFKALTGKATFVIAQVERDAHGGGKVTVLNVGDSGVAIVDSRGAVVARTPVGIHKPNMPHQLKSSVMGAQIGNAKLWQYTAPAGSRILIYSDGVTDNVFPHFYGPCTRAAEIAAYVAATVVEKAGPPVAPIGMDDNFKGHRSKEDDVSLAMIKL
jgi:hypothetical protein